MSPAVYDRIGQGYAAHRRPDPRIQARIHAALGDARTVLDVGAGSGSYEPAGCVGVEPSWTMLEQRGGGVQAVAERLPFADGAFDATLAVLTIHHWNDLDAGLAELGRVSRRQVVVTFDWDVHDAQWLIADYVPEVAGIASGPLPAGDVEVVPCPADCTDGFIVAYWNRPERLLDPAARAACSGFALLDDDLVATRIDHLADDLATGAWHERHGHLLDLDELDVGLRIVVTEA